MRVLGHRPRKPPPPPWRPASLRLLLTSLVASACILCYYATQHQEPTSHARTESSARPPLFLPTVESLDGTRVIWELPGGAPPRAALFLAPGCARRPEDFWPPSPRCPRCAGLPEHRAIVARPLERGFAVLAAASAGPCWSPSEEELTAVKRAIEHWAKERGLAGLPMAALGASSGGGFVSRLARELRFCAITVMIAAGSFGSAPLPHGYPPTLFVQMPKDRRRAALVERNVALLRQKGVNASSVRSLEFPLTPSLLSERIPGLDTACSATVFHVLREERFVDERGYMRSDGRATPWKRALEERGLLQGEGSLWLDHIQEELNLAYAYHEMTSLRVSEIFQWFEDHLSGDYSR